MGWSNGGRTETENKERVILIEGAITGLARNLTLERFPGIHKDPQLRPKQCPACFLYFVPVVEYGIFQLLAVVTCHTASPPIRAPPLKH